MEDKLFFDLIKDLNKASKECWKAKAELQDLCKKYAPVCIQILIEGRQIPKLINNRMDKRKNGTGLDPVHPDFWDADMIIALDEHFRDIMPGWIEEAMDKSRELVSNTSN